MTGDNGLSALRLRRDPHGPVKQKNPEQLESGDKVGRVDAILGLEDCTGFEMFVAHHIEKPRPEWPRPSSGWRYTPRRIESAIHPPSQNGIGQSKETAL